MKKILQFLSCVIFLSGSFACATPDDIGTNAVMPDLSPAGDKIVFVSNADKGADLWIANVDGTDLKKLTTGFRVWYPKWSPDGRKIAFGSDNQGQIGIWILNLSDKSLFHVTDGGDDPAWSPDGNRIAFTDGDGNLYVVNADGINKIALGNFLAGFPDWSPDESKIVFQRNYKPNFWNLWVINIDGTGLTQLTSEGYIDWNPRWAVDGTKIIFTSTRTQGFVIYTINSNGSAMLQLTDGFFPVWSKDQQKIVSQRGANIWLMDSSGNNPQQITHF